MDLKKWAWLRFVIPIAIGFIGGGLVVINTAQFGQMGIILIVVCGTIYKIADIKLWKCPSCNGYIGKNRVKTCRCCGEEVF